MNLQFITSQIASINAFLNTLKTNAKRIFELPTQTTLDLSSKIHVSRGGVDEQLELQLLVSSLLNNTQNRIISIDGDISVSTLDVIVPPLEWSIENLIYSTSTNTVIPITLCSSGFKRKVIIVANDLGSIIQVNGEETDSTIVPRPLIPVNSILVTEFEVTDSAIGTIEDPFIGESYVKKIFSSSYAYSNSGTLQILPLRPDGRSLFTLTNNSLVSVSGFDLSLITGNPSAEIPYLGKWFLIWNRTGTDITLIANESVDLPFLFNSNLVVPNDSKLLIFYNGIGFIELFRSWGVSVDTSIDNSLFKVIKSPSPIPLQDFASQTDTALLNARSTGIRYGGNLSDQGIGVVRIEAGEGGILDNSIPSNPEYTAVTWVETDLDLSTFNGVNFIGVNSSGNIFRTYDEPSHEDYRTNIWLWRVSVIGGVYSNATPIVQPLQQYGPQIWDIWRALGSVKRDLNLSAASTNLTVKVSAGEIYQAGANFFNNPLSPAEVEYSEKNPATFRLVTANGTQTTDRTTLDVGNYDLSNTVTAIPGSNSRAQIWTVKMFAGGGGVIRIFYGQKYYNTISEAYSDLNAGLYVPTLPISYDNAITLGWIITQKNATNLADGVQVFVTSNNFGAIGGAISSGGTGYLPSLIDSYTDVSLPLVDTDEFLVNRSGTWYKVDKSEISGGGGASKRTFFVEIPISQNIAGSTNWYTRGGITQNVFNATFTTNASLTPVNDFADHIAQTPCNVVPFASKIKSVVIRGHTNSTATDVRFVVVKSDRMLINQSTIVNSEIIADKTITTNIPNANVWSSIFSGLELDDTVTIEECGEIRLLLFNNNTASNLYTTVCGIEFEEI